MPKNILFLTSFLVLIAFLKPDDCNGLEYGVTAGYTHSYFSGEDSDEFGSRNSFTGGLFSSVSFSNTFSLELGIQYVKSGADGENVVFAEFDSGLRMIPVDATHRIDYIAIPLKIRANSPIRLGSLVPSLAVGLVPSVNLSATTKFSPSDSFTRQVFEDFNIPFIQDIENIKFNDLWLLVAAGLDLPVLGRVLRMQAEWTYGLTTPFGDWECRPPSSNPSVGCETINGLFNYGRYETTAAMLHNRSLMMTVSLIL